MTRPIYLDCNATAPLDPRVAELVMRFMTEEFGNAGSRTHVYGTEAAKAVNRAREQLAAVLSDEASSIVFTSGATESNNISILGLADFGRANKRTHIVSTEIEHKAVLEPLEYLRNHGFEVTLIPPTIGGWIDPDLIAAAIRPTTILVSVMHVNNETGVIQPIDEIAQRLAGHDAYFHTDAAQGFGKELHALRNPRLDLISISGHKIYGPKGVGALAVRKRRFKRPPLTPITFGGGQERALRPGTLPVHLIAGLGLAAELAQSEHSQRAASAAVFKSGLLNGIEVLSPEIHGDRSRTLPTTINFSIPGLDSEAAMLGLKEIVAISNGSACTSAGHHPSHVLSAMGLPGPMIAGAMRWSWSHSTISPDWKKVVSALRNLL